MKTNYESIKNKINTLDKEQADKYIDKMYNNGLLTVNQLQKLDDFIFQTKVLNIYY